MVWNCLRILEKMTVKSKLKRAVEYVTHKIAAPIFRNFASMYFDVNIIGELPKGAGICVFNHNVNFDGLINGAFLNRDMHYLVQREGIYNHLLLRPFFWASGQIPINVDISNGGNIGATVARRCKEYSQEKRLIGIFSEGPSSRLLDSSGNVIPVEDRKHYPLAAGMALSKHIPIIPIGLYTDPKIGQDLWRDIGFTKSRKYMNDYNKAKRKDLLVRGIGDRRFRASYVIAIGKSIQVENYLPKNSQSIEHLTNEVQDRLIGLVNRAKDYSHNLELDLTMRID
jgi:1-acyl-sn-glycerol-3-phosphate acyltransferase